MFADTVRKGGACVQNCKSVVNVSGNITSEERERRERAEARFSRKDVLIQLPHYLDDDPVGQETWCYVLENAADMNIFDNLDRDALGSYCAIVSRAAYLRQKYRSSVLGHRKTADVMDYMRELRMLEAQQLNYASKLGLTPESRMRLARGSADEDVDDGGGLYG